MSALAKVIARWVWWWMLRFMRLPRIRSMRQFWMRRVPDATRRRMLSQDRFARRNGEKILAFCVTILLASFTITGCYFLALYLFQAGILSPTSAKAR